MKTKMNKVFSIACLLLLVVLGVQAQSWKYPRVENGNIIVSHDANGGVKSGALLTAEQKTWLLKTNKPNGNSYNETDAYNRVSAKFEVASANAVSGEIEGWGSAFRCNYSSNWRLPTQREWMLIWILKDKLSLTIANGAYWSSTQTSSTSGADFWEVRGWAILFPLGNLDVPLAMSGKAYVRCVKDIID